MDTITEDFNRVADLLDRNAEADVGIVDFEMLDGFLCAVATAPTPIDRDAWIAEVMPEPPSDPAERDALLGALQRVYDAVVLRLSTAVDEQEDEDPLLRIYVHGLNPDGTPTEPVDDAANDSENDADDAESPFALGELWAIGFTIGTELADEAWNAATEEWPLYEEVLALTDLLLPDPPEGEFDAPDEGDAQTGLPEPIDAEDDDALPTLGAAERAIAIGELSEALHELYALNEQRAAARQTVRRPGPKVGRNDPCPCGSGRKYKLCHGGN